MPKSKERELKATSAEEWRTSQEAGQLVKLPSGKVARLARPHLLALIKTGQIPDPLSAQVMGLFNGKNPAEIQENINAEDMLTLINTTVRVAFIEPKVADDPGPDEISTNDIDFEDKMFVFWWSQGGTADLALFRREQARVVETSLGGGKVSPKTKQPAQRKR